MPKDKLRILFVSDLTVSSVIRQELIGKRLFERGHDVYMANVNSLTKDRLMGYDMISFIRPVRGVADIMAFIKAASKGTFLVCDQDDCFDAIPKHHVAYKYLGKGSPEQAKATTDAFMMANRVVVSTPKLQEYYQQFNPVIVPNGWDGSSLAWSQPNTSKNIVLGFVGTATHVEDFKLLLDPVRQIMREYSQVRILIGVDERIYKWFSNFDNERKMFLPMLPYTEYPLAVRRMHIMLVPLQNDEFNQYKSDIKLVEAGAGHIPWVASPLPHYQAWGKGGLFASNQSEFYNALRSLVTSEELRLSLGQEGYSMAKQRESNCIVDLHWEPILQEAKEWAQS